ncbi:MAG: hypothetical protein Q8R76_02225 [Candidatus Omnitrophota bacterium]|nr:hypothetical protein [Candidatus Omnitrophota bacterium]
MKQNRFPKGWDEDRVKRVLDHYEDQTEDESVAEDEAAWEDSSQTFIEVPNELVPAVRELLARKVA